MRAPVYHSSSSTVNLKGLGLKNQVALLCRIPYPYLDCDFLRKALHAKVVWNYVWQHILYHFTASLVFEECDSSSVLISVDSNDIPNGNHTEDSPTSAPSKINRIPLSLNVFQRTKRKTKAKRSKKDKDSTSNSGSIKDSEKDSESMYVSSCIAVEPVLTGAWQNGIFWHVCSIVAAGGCKFCQKYQSSLA